MVGILCFPAGWDNENVRGICGKEANDYALGLCGIRWAFVMAFICVIGELYESFDHKRALVKYQSQSEVIKVMLY